MKKPYDAPSAELIELADVILASGPADCMDEGEFPII